MIFINHSEILDGKVTIVDLKGSLDSSTCVDFENYINELLDKEKIFLIFDGAGLEFVSSAGIGVMLFIQQKISQKNGAFVLFNLADEIKALYSILGFDSVFKMAISRIDAMQVMDKHIEMRDGDELDSDDEIIEEQNLDSSELEQESDRIEFEMIDDVSENNDVDEERIIIEESDEEIIVEAPQEFEPFVVECIKCEALVRVSFSGDFKCPDCDTEFTVKDNKTVVF